MKILFIILMIPIVAFSQSNDIKVVVTKQKTFGEAYTDAFNSSFNSTTAAIAAGAAGAAARAASETARLEAMKDNYSNINIDLLKDNTDKYEFVVAKSVTENNIIEVKTTLQKSKIYSYISQVGPKRFWTHKIYPPILSSEKIYTDKERPVLNPEKILYLSFNSESQGMYTKINKVLLEDYTGKIIFQADYKNIDYSTMLKPLLLPYYTTEEEKQQINILEREEALKKIKDAKELLDLGVISKDEFNVLVEKYKPILLRDF